MQYTIFFDEHHKYTIQYKACIWFDKKKIGIDITLTFTNYKVYTKYLKLIHVTIKPLEIENKPFNSFILVQLKKSGRGVLFSAFLCNVYFTKLRWISISMVKGFRFIEHLCSIVNRVCEKAYLLRKKKLSHN